MEEIVHFPNLFLISSSEKHRVRRVGHGVRVLPDGRQLR